MWGEILLSMPRIYTTCQNPLAGIEVMWGQLVVVYTTREAGESESPGGV